MDYTKPEIGLGLNVEMSLANSGPKPSLDFG